MISIEPFTEYDFDRLINWVKSEDELIRFAGPLFRFPLTHDQLYNYLSQTKKTPYRVVLDDTQQVIGHCELNFENEMPRLSRILIGEENMRNKGLGKQVLKKIINMLFTTTDSSVVDLSVFEDNLNAVACYQKIGFSIRPGHETFMLVNGQNWKAVNMILNRSDYQLTFS